MPVMRIIGRMLAANSAACALGRHMHALHGAGGFPRCTQSRSARLGGRQGRLGAEFAANILPIIRMARVRDDGATNKMRVG